MLTVCKDTNNESAALNSLEQYIRYTVKVAECAALLLLLL